VAIPEVSAPGPAGGLIVLGGRTEEDLSAEFQALDIDPPALQPKPVLPAIEAATLEAATEDAKPDVGSIAPLMPPVIHEDKADDIVVAAVQTSSAPESALRGAAITVEPARSSPALVAAPPMAQVDVVTEPEPATEKEAPSSAGEPALASDVAMADTVSESASVILEESAATPTGETPVTRSGAVDEATSIAVERRTKPKDGRRRRERKRVMGQINRYR
jgi:hypothetical protein